MTKADALAKQRLEIVCLDILGFESWSKLYSQNKTLIYF